MIEQLSPVNANDNTRMSGWGRVPACCSVPYANAAMWMWGSPVSALIGRSSPCTWGGAVL